MKHFDLLLLPEGKGPFAPCAYIYVNACCPYGEKGKDPRAGYQILRSESMSATECYRQIDGLIEELQRLKKKASRFFETQPD